MHNFNKIVVGVIIRFNKSITTSVMMPHPKNKEHMERQFCNEKILSLRRYLKS